MHSSHCLAWSRRTWEHPCAMKNFVPQHEASIWHLPFRESCGLFTMPRLKCHMQTIRPNRAHLAPKPPKAGDHRHCCHRRVRCLPSACWRADRYSEGQHQRQDHEHAAGTVLQAQVDGAAHGEARGHARRSNQLAGGESEWTELLNRLSGQGYA